MNCTKIQSTWQLRQFWLFPCNACSNMRGTPDSGSQSVSSCSRVVVHCIHWNGYGFSKSSRGQCYSQSARLFTMHNRCCDKVPIRHYTHLTLSAPLTHQYNLIFHQQRHRCTFTFHLFELTNVKFTSLGLFLLSKIYFLLLFDWLFSVCLKSCTIAQTFSFFQCAAAISHILAERFSSF